MKKVFGCSTDNQVTYLIITSVKDTIYQKKKGKEMMISDVKRCYGKP